MKSHSTSAQITLGDGVEGAAAGAAAAFGRCCLLPLCLEGGQVALCEREMERLC